MMRILRRTSRNPGTGPGSGTRLSALLVLVAISVPVPPATAADTTPTLDEITIEGEIAMPQVLFITAREPFRYQDTHHRSYLPDAAIHADWIPFPTSIWIIGHERPSTLGTPQGPADQG